MNLENVLVIGNGPQPSNLDELITSATCVIRFNACKGNEENKRTDVLCIAADGVPPTDLVDVKEIWLWHRESIPEEWYPGITRILTAGEDQRRAEEVESRLRPDKMLSSGTLAIFRLMHLKAGAVTLVGCTWEGWWGHDWPIDREYCEELESLGKLKVIHQHRKSVFLPFYGEFGHLILEHIRYVHAFPAHEKIVFCEKGQECLFPTATGFRYDWKNFVPDEKRGNSGSWCSVIRNAIHASDEMFREKLSKEYPDSVVIRQGDRNAPKYDCKWHTSDNIKPNITARHALQEFDVAIQARWRARGEARNFAHWPAVIKRLKSIGLRIAVVGHRDTSYSSLDWDVRAWDHPDGPTAGTVDALTHCKVYLGTDSGVSHLAALMNVPMVVFRNNDGSPVMTPIMQRSTRGRFEQIDAWDDPTKIATAVIGAIWAEEDKVATR